jgi:hypothetical protein
MNPPTRTNRDNTQPTFAEGPAKAAAVKELEKAVAGTKRTAAPFDQCDPNPTIAENGGAAFFASLLSGETSFAPLTELNPPENPGKLEHSENGQRVMNRTTNAHEKLKKMKKEKKRIEDENDGKSLEVAIKEHPANGIDLAVPALVPAGNEMGWRESLRDGSYNTKESKESKDFLHGDSDNALGQQNGLNLTRNQVQTINYRATMRGHPATNAGYQIGSMGTTVNPQGKTVDAAISKATKAMNNLGEHNQTVANDWDTEIPRLAREQGMEDSGVPEFGLRLINKENEPFDLRIMSEQEIRTIRELCKVIVGFQIREPSEWDNFIRHIRSDEAKKADNMPGGKKARNAAWRRLRDSVKKSFIGVGTKMRFECERYDEDGVLPDSVGPTATRKKNAGIRFKIKDPENQRFEL